MARKKINFRGKEISAFLQNARRLSFEEQVLLGAHVTTAFSCFLPWVSYDPLYGPSNYQNAFSGATWLIGTLIFLASMAVMALFVDRLLDKHVLRKLLPEDPLLKGGSIFSIILLICAWSVIINIGQGYAGVELRFGLALCLISQVSALVSLWLRNKSEKKSEAEEFFQLPIAKKSRQSAKTHHK